MIEKLASRVAYQNNWMTVREDEVRFPNGHESIYGVVDKPDFSLVIPVEKGGFHLVKQFRYPVQGAFWEFPQGTYEGEGIGPLEQAKQELQQETGLVANFCEEIGFLYQAYGYSSQGYHIYVAENFKAGEQELEITESDMVSQWFSEEDFKKMIEAGEIRDGTSVAAYARYLSWEKKKNSEF